MKLIAVTQRTQEITEYHETRDCLDQRWYGFFSACDIIPFLVPNHPETVDKLITENLFQGILLSGGNDSPARMLTENKLLTFAINNKLPVFGVCHGMQFIQQYFGIPLQKISGHVAEAQEILINNNPTIINSYHHYGTTETSEEFTVWARAHDGIIKAIQHRNLPIIGIMWHPERCSPLRIQDIQLIKHFFAGELSQCEALY